MTFRRFMNICSKQLKLPKEKLFFEHRYLKGGYESYRVGIVGNPDYQVAYSNKQYISQLYCFGDFTNCDNLLVALDKLKREVEYNNG